MTIFNLSIPYSPSQNGPKGKLRLFMTRATETGEERTFTVLSVLRPQLKSCMQNTKPPTHEARNSSLILQIRLSHWRPGNPKFLAK